MFLEINNVSKTYGNYKALNDISLNVPENTIYGLLGPNGAGKTTLIRILNQITAPDTGTVEINGETLGPQHIACIGYLPEERGLYKKMKVGEQAIYLAQLKGLSAKEADIRLRRWFRKLDIIGWWDKTVEELSKGMQQKIQFVVTVVHEPKLLIFDEPFSGFDPINVNILKNEILELKDKGATILFSTHNMASVEELCDNITLINKGSKVLEGSVYDIKQQFKDYTCEVVMKTDKEISVGENFTIINKEEKKNGLVRLVIRIESDIASNALISSLLSQGEIISYQELLPSMNDIFIKQINNYKP